MHPLDIDPEMLDDTPNLDCKNTLHYLLQTLFPQRGWSAGKFVTGNDAETHLPPLRNIIRRLSYSGDYFDLFYVLTYLYFGKVDQDPHSEKIARDYAAIDGVLKECKVRSLYNKDLTLYDLYLLYVDTLFTCDCHGRSIGVQTMFVATKLTICQYVLGIPEADIPNGVPAELCDSIYQRITQDGTDPDEKDRTDEYALGVLASILPAYRFNNNVSFLYPCVASFFAAMENHILPLFLKSRSNTVRPNNCLLIIGLLLSELKLVMPGAAWTLPMDAHLVLTLLRSPFPNEEFLRHFLVSDDPKLALLEQHTAMGALLAEAVTKHTSLLQDFGWNEEGLNTLFLWSLILLFMHGENEQCINLLSNDANKALILKEYRQKPLMILLIGKLCATCDDKDDAENLKVFLPVGLSDKKLLAQRQEVLDATIKMCEKLLKMEELIRGDAKLKHPDVAEVLYGSNQLHKDIQHLLEQAQKGNVPTKEEYRLLCRTANAFAFDNGHYYRGSVRLGLLSQSYNGIPGYVDGDDTLFISTGVNYEEILKLQDSIKVLYEEKHTLWQTHFAQLEDPNGWFALKMVFDRYLADLAVQSAIADFDKVKLLRAAGTSDEELLKELEEQAQYLINIFYRYPDYNQDIDAAEDLIETHMKDFVDRFLPDRTNKNLFDSLSRRTRENVEKYLVTSQLVYNFLSSTGTPDQLDYSSALISLTKAIEFVLAEKLYTPMKANVENPNYSNDKYSNANDSNDDDKSQKPKKPKKPPKKPESLGAYNSYIWDILKPNATIDKNDPSKNKYPIRVESDGTWVVNNPNTHFDYYGGNNYLDIPLLKKFKGISLFTLDYTLEDREKTTVPIEKHFGDNDDENRLLLACALDYIRAKYRNPVAHKDPVAKELFESAQLSLLYEKEHQNAQALLFVLLSIVK